MSNETRLGVEYFKELEIEKAATRKCLERVPESLFEWKPHEKSMNLGNLAVIVSDIPRWLTYIIKESEIDFATYGQFRPKTNAELVSHFDEVFQEAAETLQNVSDAELRGAFYLKNSGQVLMSSSKKESVSSSINHLVHHRGQLTIYMRLNNIPVPSIYGPSGDERGF